jgi:hypothetical protein
MRHRPHNRLRARPAPQSGTASIAFRTIRASRYTSRLVHAYIAPYIWASHPQVNWQRLTPSGTSPRYQPQIHQPQFIRAPGAIISMQSRLEPPQHDRSRLMQLTGPCMQGLMPMQRLHV